MLLQDIPERLRVELNAQAEEEVVCTQLSAEANCHRDAAPFSSGREVLLQRLKEGQRALALSLSLPDEAPQREEFVAVAR